MLHRLLDRENGIGGHSVELLRACLRALQESGAKFVSLRQMVETWRAQAPVDPDWVVFTIDDGFADQAMLAREVFGPMGCPVTIFLISGFLDGDLWPWDDQLAFVFKNAAEQEVDVAIGEKRFRLRLGSQAQRLKALSAVREHFKKIVNLDPYVAARQIAASLALSIPQEPPAGFRPMTWDAARALELTGTVEFGPHSVTHRIFSAMSDENARFELETSWSRLRKELRRPLPIFAWPTGRLEDFSARDTALARELGLHACVTSNAGYAHRESHTATETLFRINRFALPESVTTTLRYASWLERARELLPF